MKAPDGATATVLATSSKDSWVMTSPYNLDPLQRWTQDMVKEQSAKTMMVDESSLHPRSLPKKPGRERGHRASSPGR